MKAKVLNIRPVEVEPLIYLASGTPVSENPMSAFAILKILDPELIPYEQKFSNYFLQKQHY